MSYRDADEVRDERSVEEYRTDDSVRCQWMFTDITAASFHWTFRASADEGSTWTVDVDMFLRRVES